MLTIRKIKQEYLKALGDQQQWLITSRNEMPIVINCYSQEEFALYQMPQKINRKKLQQYKLRQIYNLPNTPRVLLLQAKNNNQEPYLLLGQKAPFSFEKLLSYQKQPKEVLQLFQKIVLVIQMLTKKYGYFSITQNMIKGAKGFGLVIWFNENQIQNVPQFPVVANSDKNIDDSQNHIEASIIKQIVHAFQRSSNLDIWHQIASSNKNLNFNEVVMSINEKLRQISSISKIHLNDYSQKSQKQKKTNNINTNKNIQKMPEFLKNRHQQSSKSKYSSASKSKYIPYKIFGQRKQKKKNQINFSHQYIVSDKNSQKHSSAKVQQTKNYWVNKNRNQISYCTTPTQKQHCISIYYPASKQSLLQKNSRDIRCNEFSISGNESLQGDFFSPIKRQHKMCTDNNKKKTVSTKKQNDARSCKNQQIKTEQMLFNLKQPDYQQHYQSKLLKQIEIANQRQKKQNKFRESGHSSTTAQYYSINSSGNRQTRNQQDQMINNFAKNRPKLVSTFGAKSKKQKAEDSPSGRKFKQSGKLDTKVSKIIQQTEQNFLLSPSHRSPRSPSIVNKKSLTQQSIQTPGSQFQKQVSNLFNSGVFQHKNEQIESMEQELNNILFA